MRDRWNRNDWLILGGLLALVIVVWWRVIFTREWSFGVELDFIRQFYPARVYAADSLAAGTFPLWNPYLLCGHPFFASYQTAMLYPLNLVMVGAYGLAGAEFTLRAQCAFVVFHFFMAGAFTYLLARDMKLGRVASAIAAVTFMFCGFMVAHSGHLNQMSAAAWIPLIFLLFRRSLLRRKISLAVWAGVVMAVALFAGHLQSVFYTCVLLLGFAVFVVLQRWNGDPRRPGPLFSLSALIVTVGVAAGLAAVQLVPLYELIGQSTRSVITMDIAAPSSLPRWQLVGLVFPKFFGETPDVYVGGWLMWELYGYSGIVAGILGFVALLRKRRGTVIFLWLALIVSVVLALGPQGYMFTWLFKAGLFFNRFRDPARTLVIFGFCSGLLAGFGADHLFRTRSEERLAVRYRSAVRLVSVMVALLLLLVIGLSVFMMARGPDKGVENRLGFEAMVLPVLFALLLLAFLARSRKPGGTGAWLKYALVGLVVLDIAFLNCPWVLVEVDPGDIFEDRAASEYVAARDGVFRVETDANTMYESLDNGAIYGLEKASGDDSLVLRDYYRYRELIVPSVSPGVQLGLFYEGGVRSPLLDAMNDGYFLTRSRIPPVLAEDKFIPLTRLDGITVYRNRTVLPRARMNDSLAFADEEQVFRRMAETRGEGIEEESLVVWPERAGGWTPATRAGVEVVINEPHRVVVETDPGCRGLLVVSDVYYPGWKVFVDGEEEEILQTDLLFRGVSLGGGQHQVEFVYRPGSLKAGLAVSLATLAILIIYSAWPLAARLLGRMRRGMREREVV